ncbi:hypothetical protein LCGC14_1094750 [marine sediment metagenome]|uniref:DUF7768 domain-containing protein n=1 Tax=marine sediment metagenome TaxID=412755 RepID=A0A0F9MZ24_9ZZZZ
MRVYIAGPYTNGDIAENIRRIIEVAERVVEAGHIPFVPHLFHLWHLMSPHKYEYWMALDQSWMGACDAFIALDLGEDAWGDSQGTQEDVNMADQLGIEVYSVEEFFKFVSS